MMRDAVSLHEWRLIFEQCTTQELSHLCLVDKIFNSIATPLLYRSISLVAYENLSGSRRLSNSTKVKTESELPTGPWLLLSRLEADENDTLRAWVQEINISSPSAWADEDFLERLQSNDCLATLIARLPNLRRITIGFPSIQSTTLIRTIYEHKRKPELLLLNQYSEEVNSSLAEQTLPRVTTLSASLTGEETYPPLEHLCLDGYRMDDQQWRFWRDGLQWDKLVSLAVGPQSCAGLFRCLVGFTRSLKILKVSVWEGEGDDEREELIECLSSFDSLETLVLKGYMCPVEVISRHSNLSTLCLHKEESARKERPRQVLTAEELSQLDVNCPKLKSLQVGVKRENDQWPDDVFDRLATGFHNLRSLSMHFELGLSDIHNPITPLINYVSVRSIGQNYFDRRKQAGIEVFESFTLTVWTGKYFRRFPQRPLLYAGFEKKFSATYEISLPSDSSGEVQVRHLEKERLDLVNSKKIKVHSYERFRLAQQVAAAVEGPKVEDCSE
ncbi:similar to An15g02310 [Aspergillus luchuensis]|uniref:Similar to An15g02310 n=1 Tax=Aspergillus kawachii TaxID=1069201 RepID=A0A146FXK6_ASPKA|nr:similar to An15g02310 [Aspergillus luchuensis]